MKSVQRKGWTSTLGGGLIGPPVSGGGGLGMEVDVIDPEIEPEVLGKPAIGRFALERGWKAYELKNHLGNVLAVVSDLKIGKGVLGAAPLVGHYEADVLEMADYYPFGMVLPKRSWSAGGRYRFGFNGKEQDDEWNGAGNMLNYGFRIHDPRLGRFLSVDPLAPEYPWYTPYQYAGNRPINSVDLDGLEEKDSYFQGSGDDATMLRAFDSQEITAKVSGGGFWNGIGGFFKGIGAFFAGAANALGSNNLLGAGRMEPSEFGDHSGAAEAGQVVGDVISLIQGGYETCYGLTATGVGVVLDGTVVLVPAGAPVTAGGVLATAHGGGVFLTAWNKLFFSKSRSEKNASKALEHGGGKNAQHKNPKAKESAAKEYERVKAEYEQAKSKPNRTRDETEKLGKLEKQVKHWKRKKDETGENHSQGGGKGY